MKAAVVSKTFVTTLTPQVSNLHKQVYTSRTRTQLHAHKHTKQAPRHTYSAIDKKLEHLQFNTLRIHLPCLRVVGGISKIKPTLHNKTTNHPPPLPQNQKMAMFSSFLGQCIIVTCPFAIKLVVGAAFMPLPHQRIKRFLDNYPVGNQPPENYPWKITLGELPPRTIPPE